MTRRPSQRLRRALADLASALDTLDAPSMIIGGIAVIAHGVARQTIDIDGTVHAGQASISHLLAALAEPGLSGVDRLSRQSPDEHEGIATQLPPPARGLSLR